MRPSGIQKCAAMIELARISADQQLGRSIKMRRCAAGCWSLEPMSGSVQVVQSQSFDEASQSTIDFRANARRRVRHTVGADPRRSNLSSRRNTFWSIDENLPNTCIDSHACLARRAVNMCTMAQPTDHCNMHS